MSRKLVLIMTLTILFIGILGSASRVQRVKASATIIIKADGSIDPPTANITSMDNVTYTFIGDINESIVVEKDDIVIDGDAFALEGVAETITGISISGRRNVTVMNLRVSDFCQGIWLYNSDNNTLINNVVLNCTQGVRLENSNYNSVKNNTVMKNDIGIFSSFSSYNDLFNNTVFENHQGVWLLYETKNTLRNNTFVNTVNFGVYGWPLQEYLHDVDVSNTVNGKPIYYWINHHNETVPFDAGCAIIVNSTNITVENLTLTNNDAGVLLSFTKSSMIRNVTAVNNFAGIWLARASHNTITNNNVSNNDCGIYLEYSSYNTVTFNIAVNNKGMGSLSASGGIYLEDCLGDNVLAYNFLANNTFGIGLDDSYCIDVIGNEIINTTVWGISLLGDTTFCTIRANSLIGNFYGIYLASPLCLLNKIFHNNFINNSEHVYLQMRIGGNTWDDGYPSGGNYWDDYNGTDLSSGPYQNGTGSDGIGDTQFYIYEYNQDNYPLMGMFSDFNATSDYHVQTICNSTISDFQFNNTAIHFNVSGENGTTGCCRICIPTTLMNDTFRIFVNGTEILPSPEPLPCSNSTHNYIYFTYNHSTQEVVIIPEFPSFLVLPLFMAATLIAVVICRRKLQIHF